MVVPSQEKSKVQKIQESRRREQESLPKTSWGKKPGKMPPHFGGIPPTSRSLLCSSARASGSSLCPSGRLAKPSSSLT